MLTEEEKIASMTANHWSSYTWGKMNKEGVITAR